MDSEIVVSYNDKKLLIANSPVSMIRKYANDEFHIVVEKQPATIYDDEEIDTNVNNSIYNSNNINIDENTDVIYKDNNHSTFFEINNNINHNEDIDISKDINNNINGINHINEEDINHNEDIDIFKDINNNINGINHINDEDINEDTNEDTNDIYQNDIYCDCNILAARFRVKKQNENYGRYFYCCAKSPRCQCEFFLWGDEYDDNDYICCDCNLIAARIMVKQRTMNHGRYYYMCANDPEGKCQFFKWVD
ncbi:10708_t:CDS:2 [Racocetra persica]|uniref:10708_t:CDS:1 n=1 Tax=Racocetra persica TaxID=160502 RepID=A0ACA9KJJ1_9GLOM|nr:10708_t:CDS:2 [Racocetra persica]